MRIMAIDYGDARTGVAISDPFGMLDGYTTVIHSRNQDKVVEELKKIIAEHGVDELVLGWPKNMNATLGERSEKSLAMGERLKEETKLPLTMWDERRTTVDAHRILTENGRHGKKRKNTVDAVAATLILEGFLTYKRLHPNE